MGLVNEAKNEVTHQYLAQSSASDKFNALDKIYLMNSESCVGVKN